MTPKVEIHPATTAPSASILKRGKLNVRPKVFDYSDYRLYLRDIFSFLKSQRRVSLRRISNMAGFKSCSYLRMIINDQRNLSEKSCLMLAKALSLSVSETEHLWKLVRLIQSPMPIERAELRKEIERRQPAVVYEISADEVKKVQELIERMQSKRSVSNAPGSRLHENHIVKIYSY